MSGRVLKPKKRLGIIVPVRGGELAGKGEGKAEKLEEW